jgi:hypothetical protein
MEQFSRRSNLRISGLSVNSDGGPKSAFLNCCASLGASIGSADLSNCFFSGKEDKHGRRSVLVTFASQSARLKALKLRRRLRDSDDHKDIYFSEDLTKRRFTLFRDALKAKRDVKWHSVWSFKGDIFIKFTRDDTPAQVLDAKHLRALIVSSGDIVSRSS